MVRKEEIEMAEEYFDSLDYNNQRNYLWCLVDIARANEQGKRYDLHKFPYEHTIDFEFAGTEFLPSEGLSDMGKILTANMGKMTWRELRRAA